MPGAGCLGRRQFIQHVAFFTAVSTVLGRQLVQSVAADCTPVAPGAGILRVRLSDFPALQADNGSVRLLLNNLSGTSSSTCRTSTGPFPPILVNRGTGAEFWALRAVCTHNGSTPLPWNASTNARCPCHGSRFAQDGTVVQGPATTALTRFPIFFDGVNTLCIEIPNLGFSVTGAGVETVAGSRYRLTFPTRTATRYEVRLRQDADDEGAVVPFSTTEAGALTTTVLTGNNTPATVYVARPAGQSFLSVAMQVVSG